VTDIVSKATRSRMMAGIKVSKTKPEMQVRALMRGCGHRRSYDVKTLPGRPDIVIRKKKVAIFVHGCFWHQHACHLFKWPSSRRSFWKAKLDRNRARDERCRSELRRDGWRVLVVWECALRGTHRRPDALLRRRLSAWLGSRFGQASVAGIARK